MKKLLISILFTTIGCFAQSNVSNYIISAGGGLSSYNSPASFGYGSVAIPLPAMANFYNISTVELTRKGANIRTGLGKDIATNGRLSLFVLGDVGVSTTGSSTGADFTGGGGIRVAVTKNSGFVGTVLVNRSAITTSAGQQGVQPTFTGGYYFKFGQ